MTLEIRDAAVGKWRSVILPALGITVPDHGRHGPCPVCGGKDRFRLDDKDGRGTWFCNQCEPKAGDGFALIQNVRRCNFKTAVELVAGVIGYQPDSTKGSGHAGRRPVATYDYEDEAGTLLFQALRYAPKDFRQRKPDGQGGWEWNLRGVQLVLYRLPDVLKAESVLVVEGERDVETAYRLGLPHGWAATCNPMGAGKWREEYSDTLAGRRAVILPDADEPGRKHAGQVARSLQGKATAILTLALPDGVKDLSAWAETGGTAEAFHILLNGAQPFLFMSPPKNGTLHESNFTPLPVGDFLDLGGEGEAVEWVLDEYLPLGGLALLAGKPKEGKSTFTYELAVQVAQGKPFLNRHTHGGGVLILALEEHPRDVRLRLRALGADQLPNLFVYAGTLAPEADTFEAVKQYVKQGAITLIILDTLGAFWNVRDENDAAEVTKAVKPILALARDSGACMLLIHHARKSEGAYGDEIRGSGALFAAVDLAMILKRHEVQTQRVLRAVSRYPETPAELVIELRETGYCALGDPSSLNRQARQDKINAALRESLQTTKEVSQRAGIGLRDTARLLQALAERREVYREGTGRKNSPFLFRRNSFLATPPVLGPPPQETNPDQAEFLSCDPQSPCKNRIPEKEQAMVLFTAPSVQEPESEVINLAD